MVFRQQHHVLGRANQELVVARRPFQGGPGIGTEEGKLGFDFRHQAMDESGVILMDPFQFSEGNLFVGEFTERFTVLNQCAVIHRDASLQYVYFLIAL